MLQLLQQCNNNSATTVTTLLQQHYNSATNVYNSAITVTAVLKQHYSSATTVTTALQLQLLQLLQLCYNTYLSAGDVTTVLQMLNGAVAVTTVPELLHLRFTVVLLLRYTQVHSFVGGVAH